MPTTAPRSPSVANSVSGIPGQPNDAETSFFANVLHQLGITPGAANIGILRAWAGIENTNAKNNPLATTYSIPGNESAFNNLPGGGHVWNYYTLQAGQQATAQTLKSYPAILNVLRHPDQLGGNPDVNREFNTWSGNPKAGSTVTSYVQYILSHASGEGNAASPGLLGSGTLYGAPGGIYSGSGAKAVVQTGENAYNAVVSTGKFLGELSNPNLWVRVAEVIGGVLAVGLAIYLIAKDLGLPTPDLPGSTAKKVSRQAEDLTEIRALETANRQAAAGVRTTEIQARRAIAEVRVPNYQQLARERANQARARTRRTRSDARTSESKERIQRAEEPPKRPDIVIGSSYRQKEG